jgi:hypothetical protein
VGGRKSLDRCCGSRRVRGSAAEPTAPASSRSRTRPLCRRVARRPRDRARQRRRQRVRPDRASGSLGAGGHVGLDAVPQNGAPEGIAPVDTATGNLLDAFACEGPITAATIDGQTYSLVEGTALPDDVADSNTVDGSLSRPTK